MTQAAHRLGGAPAAAGRRAGRGGAGARAGRPALPRRAPALAARAAAKAAGVEEGAEAAAERRARESARVEERTVSVTSAGEFDAQLREAGERLVVVEVESEEVCQWGTETEEQDNYWKQPKEVVFEPCVRLKHVFQRCARDCEDVRFLNLMVDGSEEARELQDRLGVKTIPSLVFLKDGAKVYEHSGAVGGQETIGEGLLFFGDAAAGGEKASETIAQLATQADFDAFVGGQEKDMLTVVDVSSETSKGSVRIYPAVLALAKGFREVAVFARLMADSDEGKALAKALNIRQVPTFLFYRNGEPVGRHVGSSRGDLIGQVLKQQNAAGLPVPPPAGKKSISHS